MELEAKNLKTNKACDRNELVIEHILSPYPITYKHLKNSFYLFIKHMGMYQQIAKL